MVDTPTPEVFMDLVTPNGQAALAATIRAFRERYGEKWMDAFKRENPDFVMVIELCANYEPEVAIVELPKRVSKEYGYAAGIAADIFCAAYRQPLFKLHAGIRAEIDKKR